MNINEQWSVLLFSGAIVEGGRKGDFLQQF